MIQDKNNDILYGQKIFFLLPEKMEGSQILDLLNPTVLSRHRNSHPPPTSHTHVSFGKQKGA